MAVAVVVEAAEVGTGEGAVEVVGARSSDGLLTILYWALSWDC